MRLSFATASVAFAGSVALWGCGVEAPPQAPPPDRFYFPTGIHHAPAADGPGTVFVASSNFDKRYDFGALSAVDLAAVGLNLPAFLGGAGDPTGPAAEPTSLTTEGDSPQVPSRVLTAAFAGVIAGTPPGPDGRLRLFVPTRSEGDNVFSVDWDGAAALGCAGAPDPETRNCSTHGLSLTAQGLATGDAVEEGFTGGKPRAPGPYSVTLAADGTGEQQLWVSHVTPADSPVGSLKAKESYLVRTSATDPVLDRASFIPIGAGASSTVAVGQRYAYVSGRVATQTPFLPLRLVDLRDVSRVLQVQVLDDFRLRDVRDVLLSADERRLFLLARDPDVLLVLSLEDPTADAPRLRVVRSIPLPEAPTLAGLVPRRPGQGALVAITCTQAHAVALYDDDTGQLATILTNVVQQPFGLAVHAPPGAPGARLFVTGFGDGRVAVVDLPDLDAPSDALVRTRLGADQRCVTLRAPPAELRCAEGGS